MKYSILFLLLLLGLQLHAQPPTVLTAEAFIKQVRQFHPLAKQAFLQVEKARADLLSARGAFDPVAEADYDRKTFDGKNYYFYNHAGIKIPTPLNFDIKTGIENNGGQFITSEVTKGQTSYAGIEMALGKGLLTDRRRTALQQARLFIQQSEQEQLQEINDLLYDAYNAYWQWAGYYQLYNIYSRYLDIATQRQRLVRISFQQGDRSAVDTVEAFAQIQNFQLLQADAMVKFNSSIFQLSDYLWTEKDSAYLLPPWYIPDTLNLNAANVALPALEEMLSQSAAGNPALRAYDFKMSILEAERRLKFQSLLPTLNARANLLNKGYYVAKGLDANLLENNYKWGLTFKMPLFLREARGEYKKAQIKIRETDLQRRNKAWNINNKINSYFTEAALLQQQVSAAWQAYNSYNTLLKAETLRFSNGESSLFLINSRENKVMETLQKVTELSMKFYKARYGVEWSAGLLR